MALLSGAFRVAGDSGIPNPTYVTCTARYGEDLIVIADNYFDKTKKNIMSGTVVEEVYSGAEKVF